MTKDNVFQFIHKEEDKEKNEQVKEENSLPSFLSRNNLILEPESIKVELDFDEYLDVVSTFAASSDDEPLSMHKLNKDVKEKIKKTNKKKEKKVGRRKKKELDLNVSEVKNEINEEQKVSTIII